MPVHFHVVFWLARCFRFEFKVIGRLDYGENVTSINVKIQDWVIVRLTLRFSEVH